MVESVFEADIVKAIFEADVVKAVFEAGVVKAVFETSLSGIWRTDIILSYVLFHSFVLVYM